MKKANIMKNMKNLVGILAFAWCACALPGGARAAGDITAITPVDESGLALSAPVASAASPLQAGATVRFAVRLTKRNPTEPNWRLHHTGGNSEVFDLTYNPFRIGVYVSGELRYAEYDGELQGANYTDFYFKYVVKPGDFALPIVLAVGANGSVPRPANAMGLIDTVYHIDPKAITYIEGVTNPAWTIDNSVEGGAAATATAVLSYKATADVLNPDYDLRGAGFYVKTLDFDEAEETDAWRAVPAGTTRTGTIHLESVPTNTATFYVWSMDESVVKVQGSETKDIHVSTPSVTESRSVAAVTLVAGQQDYTFRFMGDADAAGRSTTLVLSGFDDFNYDAVSNAQRTDYLSATVKVTTAPDPYMSLTDASGNNKVTVEATTNTSRYTEMRLTFSKAYTAGPVTVALKQKIGDDDVSAEADYITDRYFAILLDPDGDPLTSTSLRELTMPAGATELRFYVFALGSAASLKSPGLTLVPDVSAQSSEIQDFFAAGASLQKNGLLKIVDQAPAVTATAPTNGFKNDTVNVDVTVADNWRDLTAFNTNGYRVAIKMGGQTVLDTNGVHFTEGEAQSFAVKIPLEGHPLKGVVQVWDATHANNYSQAEFEIEVEPALSASPAFYPDSDPASTPYPDGYFFVEGSSPYFRVSLTADAADDMYAFLVPVNEAASNYVACSASSNGLLIARGSRTSSAATLTFLDGYSSKEPMRALFRVDLRNQPQIDAEGSSSLGSAYELKTIELACVNVSPTLVAGSMEMNATPVNSGETLMSRVPVGVEVKFRARVSDPSPVDLAATGDRAIVTRWQITDGATGRQTVFTRFATNVNGYVTCPFTFGYEDTTQEIKVWARDKDDLVEHGDLDWGDVVYQFKVNVEESPRVILSQDAEGKVTEFVVEENATKSKGFFYIQLSEPPTGYSESSLPISRNNPLVVELLTEAWGGDGFMALETNRVYFTNESNDQRLKKVYYDINSLDGGADTLYQVTARVITSTSSNAYDQAWSSYYTESSVEITVQDVDPSIDLVKRTNGTLVEPEVGTNMWSAGESVALHWKISDVLPDITNGEMTVSWSIDAASDSPTLNPQTITNGWTRTTVGRKTSVEGDYVFNVPSVTRGTVRMTVGDGVGSAVREWYFEVEQTKDLKVNVFGPAATAESKYKAAKGLGQGVVGAVGAAKVASEGFVQTWSYAKDKNSADLYAWGYPSRTTWDAYVGTSSPSHGEYVDKGGIPAAVGSSATGVPLGVNGNKWTAGPYYNWSTMGGLDSTAGDYDSFFYRWMVVKGASESGSSGGSSEETASDAAPAPWSLATTQKTITLDGGTSGKDDADATYGTVKVEAIFARELYSKDNLGDINADGIPDKIVELYGLGASKAGEMPEDDLTSLRDFNDDEDYLPNFAGSGYSTLIPGLPSTWTEGRKFSAQYEVRGYHAGLNDGARLAGLRSHRLDEDFYSADVDKRKVARDYSDLEMVAWSLTGYDVNWTPECPSDPTKADTDEDGFSDGYEYYFWYRAHVGDPEYFAATGKFRRLTGRRYDPKNPGRGTVITSEEIERLMNPRVAYGDGESAALIDTDNDGLPDLLEFELGTNPFDFDTDGDGLPDGWEIMIAGLDPLTAQSFMDGKSDTERNTDGDAMAISSYRLEQVEKPVPANIEHAKRVTFAVVDANGDTDGVQWYAMTQMPELAEKDTVSSGFQIIAEIGGLPVTFFAATEPNTVSDGTTRRIAVACPVRTLVTYTPAEGSEEQVMGYPYTLPVGTVVSCESLNVPVKSYKIAAAVAAKDANACWIYGKGSARAEIGEVAETAAEYGCLALARPLAVAADAEIAVLPSDERDVAFLHFLCYQEFGFDPRTAWSPNDPLAKRWGKTLNGEAVEGITVVGRGGYTGAPARTRAYTNYDEFLVSSFFWNNEGGQPTLVTPVVSESAPMWARIWGALTTNPQGPNEAEKTSSEHYYGRSSTNGADTDEDGVPDGWELYVMAGPKTADGAYVFAPPYAGFKPALASVAMEKSYFSPFVDAAKTTDTSNQIYLGGQANDDGLNQFQEFEGTDTMNYYADYSTTVVHDGEWTWFNKFFPTDPWNVDTDGDGLSDGKEKERFAYGTPTDDGTGRSIAGGGLNPCSVDTDCDGLPDGWESQFAGTPGSVVEGEQALGLRDGMDGTVKDACTLPLNTTVGLSAEGRVNRDYDRDGLENWQEYLTGTMRCWRYDDPVSPLTYQPRDFYFTTDPTTGEETFDATEAAKKFHAAGLLDSDDVNEFWYKTLVDASSAVYNPHLVMDTSSGAQYFSRVTNAWDAAYLDIALSGGKSTGAYYWFYDRVDGNLLKDTWGAAWADLIGLDVKNLSFVPRKYACCSPIDPDSDHDGMDDYYEVFHGLNPLLGESGNRGNWYSVNGGGAVADSDILDLVYDSMYADTKNVPQAWGEGDAASSYKNFWQRKVADASWTGKRPRGNGYDFEVFPWLSGLASADPDGDGIRNQEESIMALVSPSTVWHHTDPTPLWMTDSSYSNSLVRMNYRLPTRADVIALTESSFTYDGQTYLFSDFDGFVEDTFEVFNPDAWELVGSASAMNWTVSFEENEGFDSDHDGLGDRDEISGKYQGATDPINVDSPQRRQAMYFQGAAKPSILQTMPFVREYHPEAKVDGRYPDDLSFLQYTVECWVKAESLADSTVIERAVYVGKSNPDDREFIRSNFRIGLEGGKWYTLFDPNDTTKESVKVFSDDVATTAWTHLAATYDAKELVFYVNGKVAGRKSSGLQPTYGSAAVVVSAENGLNTATGMSYWRDREYSLHAIVLGASVKTLAQGGTASALDVTRGVGFDAYTGFFKGFVDEVRVWDGARSATEIASAKMKRFTSADAAANREAFFAEWSKSGAVDQYRGRYAKDGSGNPYALPAELRFHWAFDSLFGASEEGALATAPAGFNYLGENAEGDGGRALRSRPEGYGIAWWQNVLAGYAGTVYNDPAWICWVPNTVTHLPRYDGTTLDSIYWSDDFAGAKAGTYKFARTAEPVSFWTQYRRLGLNDGEVPYETTSSRHHLVTVQDEVSGTQLETLYAFTGRHLNQSGDDMLALGGAFAKHIDDLWDSQGASSNWEVAGADEDGDGLPDWWEELANDRYRTNPTDVIGWDTLVKWPDQNGMVMTAGEAYLRDLARGYHGNAYGEAVTDNSDGDFRQRFDSDGNGIPDWWERLYGIEGESGLDDHDNDGLPNYVEYLLSEVFSKFGVKFDPTRADSVQPGIPDYFFKVGDLYVGEIFTDHDLVDDAWEDLYDDSYASRLAYDPFGDADGDGWSNRSENRYAKQAMPIVADGQSHYSSADGLVADYPIPTIALSVSYAGQRQAAVEAAPLVVQMYTGTALNRGADATFNIGSVSNGYTRTLGKWSNRHAIGTLTPGYVDKNSIELQFAYNPSSENYSWSVGGTTNYASSVIQRGTYAEYLAAQRKFGRKNVELLSRDTSYVKLSTLELRSDANDKTATWASTATGKTFGTIDLTTGAYDLDLGAFAGQYVVNATNDSDFVSLEDQTFRIVYSANEAVGLPRKLYLGQADTGHVREGLNTVIVFADLDGDGAYTAGEPYGCVTGVDVSWKGTSVDLALTDTSPIFNRVDPIQGLDDRTVFAGTESGNYTNIITSAQPSGGLVNRIRVVRHMLIGTKGNALVSSIGSGLRRVLFDQQVDKDVNPWITEANFLATGAFDLDWETLYDDIVSKIDASGSIPKEGVANTKYVIGDLTGVLYRIVIGNEDIDSGDASGNMSVIVPVRRFDTHRNRPIPQAGNGVVTVGRPTFKWTMPYGANGYTAFKVSIKSASGAAFSWTSDFLRMPAADANGVYTWEAPVFAGDSPAGATGVFANHAAYTWSVSAYNAKYKNDDFVTGGTFRMDVQTNGYSTGCIATSVRYYGPAAVTNDASAVIRVRAYASPDFTGAPAGAGLVDKSVTAGVNCRLLGMPKGTYYLQAFVDSNNNGVCEPWESMGYLCQRDGTTADWLNPVAVKVGDSVGAGDEATIYIEDADTDGDNLPDAWEYAMATAQERTNGTFLAAKGVDRLTTSGAGEIAVDSTLTRDLLGSQYVNGEMVPTAGLASEILTAFRSSSAFAALTMGVAPNLTVGADGSLCQNPLVTEGTFAITGLAFDAAAGTVELTVAGDVTPPEVAASAIYQVKVGSTVTVKVLHTATLAGKWQEVATMPVTVSGDSLDGNVLTVPMPDVSATGGFYKVVIEQ